MTTILWFSSSLSIIFISTLSVPSFGLPMVAPPWSHNAVTNILSYIRSCDDSSSLTRSIKFYRVIILRYPLNMCSLLHMIHLLKNRDLSLLGICSVRVIFLFVSFLLKYLETTILLDYSVLLNKLCTILPPRMHLLNYDSSLIQSLVVPLKT